MYLLKTDCGMTYSAIGRLLGGLNSGGVGRICKAVNKEILTGQMRNIEEIRSEYKIKCENKI
jgi:hypothetical protein